nr:unnamed protein product [Fasciola hepatica]CAK6928240.1 unnamed protein product [Fasciola hepatica]
MADIVPFACDVCRLITASTNFTKQWTVDCRKWTNNPIVGPSNSTICSVNVYPSSASRATISYTRKTFRGRNSAHHHG